MQTVIDTWDRKMVDLFVANGANLIDDKPIAWGLVNKIRITLGVFKQYVGQYPELKEQIDIALRYHAENGNAKWVALCLWAGGDPWSRGPDEAPDWDAPVYEPYAYDDDDEDYEPTYRTAVELAVMRGHHEVLEQKKFLTAPDPKKPASMDVFEHIWWLRDSSVLKLLLERGHKPTLYKDRCSSLLTHLLCTLDKDVFDSIRPGQRDIDTYRAERQLEMIQLLLAEGALWQPKDNNEIKRVRQTLIQMAPKYTYEFVQMVHVHRAARRRDLEELVRTQAMVQILKRRSRQIPALIAELPEELTLDETKPKSD
jgi:hypothetical protein